MRPRYNYFLARDNLKAISFMCYNSLGKHPIRLKKRAAVIAA